MSIYGADVGELRTLGKQFSAAADRLDGARQTLTPQIGIPTIWLGPIAEMFRNDWNSRISRQLSYVADSLRRAAADVMRNADEQDRASNPHEGLTGGELLGGLLKAAGIAGLIDGALDVFEHGFIGPKVGGLLAGVDSIQSLIDLGQAIQNDDLLGKLVGSVDVGSSTLGVIALNAPKFGPLGLGVGALSGFIDATLPTSESDYDGVLNMGSQYMFGKSMDQLTPQQHDALNHRYDGAWGVANMISDSMDSNAQGVKDFFGKMFRG
jgi:hypothetical protein